MDHPTTPQPHLDPNGDPDPELLRETGPELGLDRAREQRAQLRLRHIQALAALMEEREDLRGVHALADYFDDAFRWSA